MKMETYVILASLTEKGRSDIQGIAKRREQNLEQLKQNGIRVIADYALMGEFDFLYIVEAPNNQTILQQVIHDASGGTLAFRTMPAMSMDQFAGIASNLNQNEG
jgi:uncharacterized protein with GYD domain